MNRIDPEMWARLSSSPPINEDLTARLAIPNVTDRLLAAIDVEARRHLLIPLHAGDDELNDSQSRGLSVNTRELVVSGLNRARYIDIECHDAAGNDAFDIIGGELASGLTAAEQTPAILVGRVLSRWRRFWGHIPRQMLSRGEQLGLFAELWFFLLWLVPRTGPRVAVARWRGPFGARHDFEWPGFSVEVKATTSARGKVHRINSLEQLAQPENGRLLLFSLRLREEGGAINTLPRLVALCRQQIMIDAEAVDQFESGLAHLSYSTAHEDEYAKMRLHIVEESLFAVEADFPRITPVSFPAGVPDGIECIEYEVNLSSCSHLILARTPAENSIF